MEHKLYDTLSRQQRPFVPLAVRKANNFAESDRIGAGRDAMGAALKDSKDGTTWEVRR